MLLSLWLPILLSTLAVHICSTIAWMLLPHHKHEWNKLPNQEDAVKELGDKNLAAGQYFFPHAHTPEEMSSDQFRELYERGPWGTLNLFPAKPSMGVNIGLTILYFLIASTLIAYLATMAFEGRPNPSFMSVFRFVGTAGIVAYCCGGWPNAIWFKRKIAMDFIDGVVYGLVTGLIFAALWPATA